MLVVLFDGTYFVELVPQTWAHSAARAALLTIVDLTAYPKTLRARGKMQDFSQLLLSITGTWCCRSSSAHAAALLTLLLCI
eukprot:1157956-Pelagomonas_calceolata.AAC.11